MIDRLLWRNQKKRADEVTALFWRAMEAFALSVEAKGHTTYEHLRRLRVYAVELAKELGVSRDDMEALRAAALLHDIGKLAIPEHIISKPGRLTPEEFEKMKIHPIVGAEILERVRFPYPVAPIVRAHHEKYDGTGYPDGLKGDKIPIGARILSAVDFFDALISDRFYRRGLPAEEVITRLQREAGRSFDPRVVEILANRHSELEELAHNESNAEHWSKIFTDVEDDHDENPTPGFLKRGAEIYQETTFLTSIAAARQEAQTLFELSQDLGSSLSLGETLSVFCQKLKTLVPYDSIAIYIRRDDVLLPEHVGGDNFRLLVSLRIPLGQGLSGWVAQNRKPIINGNPSAELGNCNDAAKFTTLRSALALPLEGIEGVVGVLTLYRVESEAFTSENLRVLLAVTSKMALAIENALKYQRAENFATTDYLTDLPNLYSFLLYLDRQLQRRSRRSAPFAVVVFDLILIDDYRPATDYKSRLESLRIAAEAIKETASEDDFVARTGDSEFTALFSVSTSEEALKRADSFVNKITAVFEGKSRLMVVGVSVCPIDGESTDLLLQAAHRRKDSMEPIRITYKVDDKELTRAFRAFLCHSSTDKTLVREVFRRLSADGVDAWLDEVKLLPGQDWKREIRQAVRASDAVIVCLSKQSVTREGFVQAELKYALDVADEKPDGTIYLIPLLFEECDVPDRLRQWHWVSYADPQWYLSLLRSLAKRSILIRTP